MKAAAAVLLLAAIGSDGAHLTPAAAANMKHAMEEIRAAFTAQTGTVVKPVYGASGKLVAQIRTGAPFDLFVSADVAWAESLHVRGLAVTAPKIYAYGGLVLWTVGTTDVSQGPRVLASPAVRRVALGDPALTVYGPAARRVLDNLGIWEQITSKAVYGNSISQVATYVATGAVDAGFTAKSIVLSEEMRGKGSWVEIDSALHDPLPQAAVILRYGAEKNPESSKAFFDFLYSPQSLAILSRYGYRIP